jgi:hypothetical protein
MVDELETTEDGPLHTVRLVMHLKGDRDDDDTA